MPRLTHDSDVDLGLPAAQLVLHQQCVAAAVLLARSQDGELAARLAVLHLDVLAVLDLRAEAGRALEDRLVPSPHSRDVARQAAALPSPLPSGRPEPGWAEQGGLGGLAQHSWPPEHSSAAAQPPVAALRWMTGGASRRITGKAHPQWALPLSMLSSVEASGQMWLLGLSDN